MTQFIMKGGHARAIISIVTSETSAR